MADGQPNASLDPPPGAEEDMHEFLAFTEGADRRSLHLVAGETCFVMKSRGKKKKWRPFARAVLEEMVEGRWRVRYEGGEEFLVREANLLPVLERGVLVCATTDQYRLAARTQVRQTDIAVEIGCDQGECCKRLADAKCAAVVGVDKAPDRIRDATSRCGDLKNVKFVVADIFHQKDELQLLGIPPRPDVVFLDINGSREYDAVRTAVDWILQGRHLFQAPPRLLVVKSLHFLRRHFPDHCGE